MQELIGNCLQNIENIKQFNRNLKLKVTEKGSKIVILKKRIVNM